MKAQETLFFNILPSGRYGSMSKTAAVTKGGFVEEIHFFDLANEASTVSRDPLLVPRGSVRLLLCRFLTSLLRLMNDHIYLIGKIGFWRKLRYMKYGVFRYSGWKADVCGACVFARTAVERSHRFRLFRSLEHYFA
jgi:hypothetical protein